MKKRGTVCPLFKLRVVGITRNRKDSTNRSSTQLREAAMSNFFYFKTTQGNASLLKTFFAMIENFLRFQLTRKSITLLFLFQNVLAPFRMPQAPIESYYGAKIRYLFHTFKTFPTFFRLRHNFLCIPDRLAYATSQGRMNQLLREQELVFSPYRASPTTKKGTKPVMDFVPLYIKYV